MKIRTIWIVLFFATMGCDFSSGQTPAATGIEGAITISPAHPGPVRDDVSSSAPLSNVTFTVNDQGGKVASFITDEQGRFRVSLKPGHYRVSVQGPGRIRRCGPFEVDVDANQITKVQWQCDSGMR